jgi:hypothetical protein
MPAIKGRAPVLSKMEKNRSTIKAIEQLAISIMSIPAAYLLSADFFFEISRIPRFYVPKSAKANEYKPYPSIPKKRAISIAWRR